MGRCFEFPHHTSVMKAFAQVRYLDHLLRRNMFEKAEKLFKRSLMDSPSVELWKRYIDYVR